MSDYMSVCQRAVRAAGSVLLEKWGHAEVRQKGRFDLVTEADFAAQDTVRRVIHEAFPEHAILGEEGASGGGAVSGSCAARWIIDHFDGTTNFVHGVPHFSVSLALEKDGQLEVGAVFNPVSGECFTAMRGHGAWLDGHPIRTSGVASLEEALGAIGFPAVVEDDSPDLRMFLRAVKVCQSIRRTGSAALNLSYVAAGRFDAAWSFCSHPWDVAAGVLLIREAGGVVTAPDGAPFSLDRPLFVAAANRRLHEALLELVAAEGLDKS